MLDRAAGNLEPILLVDDEPYVLRWLAHHLTRAGYRVETAGDGETALARARELRPALVLLDYHLPRMDGFAVCAEIKGDPDLSGTHVILMSASEVVAGCDWVPVGGAPDEFMPKPFRPGEVVRRVRAVLSAALDASLACPAPAGPLPSYAAA
jgi:DNA-binding response OmpR family regulator